MVKDIVSESAATYVSILHYPNDSQPSKEDTSEKSDSALDTDPPTAFSLARFIPLLRERIHVINPFTRTFLVSWLTLLDTIPDLELVTYLPDFLGGLFKFLSDPNRDVHVATQGALERFLNEIKKVARIKRGIAESRKSPSDLNRKRSNGSEGEGSSAQTDLGSGNEKQEDAIADSDSDTGDDADAPNPDGDWIPGQDVQVDHAKILEILVTFLDASIGEAVQDAQSRIDIQVTALRWIDSFFEISSEDILHLLPRLLSQVLPAMASIHEQVRQAANRVNTSLMEYIANITDEPTPKEEGKLAPLARVPTTVLKETNEKERRASTPTQKIPATIEGDAEAKKIESQPTESPPADSRTETPKAPADIDYAAAVNALTLQFLNEHEATRVAALAWLIMLHRKAPRKVLAFNDGTFPALLKTLSDPAEAVVTRDLQLLSQISRNSDDGFFTSFMVNLLQLFSTDRKLLETRGNLIIRQLCTSLSAERIYRTLADCLEKDEDIEFASIMVQNLNNNLITAPELAELRKRLRNLETRDGQAFFVALFRAWCQNAVATFSLCLLAQAYEQAYNLLQIL